MKKILPLKIVKNLQVGKIKKTHFHLVLISALVFSSLSLALTIPKKASAGTFGAAYVRLDRVQAETATTGLVCATTTNTVGTEADVQVVFPTGFTLSETASNWTVATTNIPSGATAWPSIATATSANNTTKTVTFPSGDLSDSTLYCFRWTGGTTLTTSTAGDDKTGTITTRTSGPATIDSDTYALSIVSDDQIDVSASVPQVFGLEFSGNTNAHGTLTAGTVDAVSGTTVTIDTNAANGWIAWVSSANGNLTSTLTSATITSPGSIDNAVSSLETTTYGYVLDVIFTDSATGTGTVTQAANFGAEYDGGNTCSSSITGGTLSTTLQPIAASSGTTDGDVLELCTLIRVNAAQTAASDYADVLTVTAAGRF